MGLEHVMSVYVIWKFAENIDGAKKFLVDYVGNFEQAFMASEFYNFPCFPQAGARSQEAIAKDTKADPADKYAVLGDSLDWATNVGYPGYATAAIDETFSHLGAQHDVRLGGHRHPTPEAAVKEAEEKCKKIWEKWKERRLI